MLILHISFLGGLMYLRLAVFDIRRNANTFKLDICFISFWEAISRLPRLMINQRCQQNEKPRLQLWVKQDAVLDKLSLSDGKK